MKKTISLILALLISASLAAPVTAAVMKYEIHGTVFDQASPVYNSTLSWDAQKFPGFWYNLATGKSSETIWINQPASSLTAGTRAVQEEKLLYNTSRTDQKYRVFIEKGLKVQNGLEYDVSTKTFARGAKGGYYAQLGWFGDRYIALNGKANKVAKMVKEQKAEEKQTLKIGETWNLGEGYTITVEALDTSVSPRQAWLSLKKGGKTLDNKVVNEGDVYTYVEKNIANESDVPVFVTFAESIFSGSDGNIVQLKYTWVISRNVTEIKAGDKFGVFEVKEADENHLLLYNKDKAINLDQNAVQPLYGDFKFRVADNAAALRFYPIREYTIQETVPAATAATPAATATIAPTTTATLEAARTAAPTETATAVPPKSSESTPVKKVLGFWGTYAIAGMVIAAYFVLRKGKSG